MKAIDETTDQEVVVIQLPERFLADGVGEFKSQVDDANQHVTKAIILDFGLSQLVDSSALGAIVSVYKRLGLKDVKLVLCGMNQTVMALFELTQLQKIFQIETDIQAASLALSEA